MWSQVVRIQGHHMVDVYYETFPQAQAAAQAYDALLRM